ncbi:MAG: hypothetical protein ACYCYO_03775 [Bacilli bacterium]
MAKRKIVSRMLPPEMIDLRLYDELMPEEIFQQHCRIILGGSRRVEDVACSLRDIYQKRGWRHGYKSFDHFVRQKLSYTPQYAYLLISGLSVKDVLIKAFENEGRPEMAETIGQMSDRKAAVLAVLSEDTIPGEEPMIKQFAETVGVERIAKMRRDDLEEEVRAYRDHAANADEHRRPASKPTTNIEEQRVEYLLDRARTLVTQTEQKLQVLARQRSEPFPPSMCSSVTKLKDEVMKLDILLNA